MAERKMNIVLDLDSTLICTDSEEMAKLPSSFGHGDNFRLTPHLYFLPFSRHDILWGVTRPGLRKFLKYCFEKFNRVIVYSAGEKKYVNLVCQKIFFPDSLEEIDSKNYPDLILSREDCVAENKFLVKPLTKIYKKFPDMDETNTLVLDDNETAFITVNKDNAIHIPPFESKCEPNSIKEGLKDTAFDEFMTWCDRYLFTSPDVRKLDKTNIFSVNKRVIPKYASPSSKRKSARK